MKRRLVLSARPRRFGKSFAAQAVVAFYSNGCDSRSLFEGLEVSQRLGWDNNLNGFYVTYLDMCELIDEVGVENIVGEAKRLMLTELRQMHPEAGLSDAGHGTELTRAILDVVNETDRKFVFVIDEWDAPYRLSGGDTATRDAYASMLRSLFKGGSFIGPALAGAFMTGILPIKKYAHQSAVSNFREYTMFRPGAYAPFVGFTEDEVEELECEYDLDMIEVKSRYDGYELRYRDRGGGGIQRGAHVVNAYAPYSVMMACDDGAVGSFWPSTEAYETICPI